MLKKLYRLSKDNDFAAVKQSRAAVYQPVFMLKFLKNGLGYSRFGLIVSNRVSKRANKRNLIKRRFREALRAQLAAIKSGYDVVIIVSPKIINQVGKPFSYQEVADSLAKGLKIAKLI